MRPAGGTIATFAAAIVAVVVLGFAFGASPTPTVDDYAGKTSLAERSLPQTTRLVDPTAVVTETEETDETATPDDADAAPEPTPISIPGIPPTIADLLALPDPGGVFAFCCADPARAPMLTGEALNAIIEAQSAFTAAGDSVGFLFMNLANGVGVASNINEQFYSASTMKAPFATFVCSVLIDGGRVTVDDSLAISYASEYLESGLDSLRVETLLEDAILYSDNDSYRVLRANLESLGFSPWLASLGLDADRLAWYWYPRYDVREAAVLWLATYDYLRSEAPHAPWLGSLLGNTEVSFIRDGIGAEPGIVIQNKAGWIGEDGLAATSDNGLLTSDGTTYLLCILSDAPDGERSEHAVATLARALFDARAALNPTP